MTSTKNTTETTVNTVREIALALPSATENPHFEKTSYRVNNKIFATAREGEDKCVLKLSLADQSALLSSDPDNFYEVGWAHQGWIGVRISAIARDTLEELIEAAWRNVAPKKLLKQLDER